MLKTIDSNLNGSVALRNWLTMCSVAVLAVFALSIAVHSLASKNNNDRTLAIQGLSDSPDHAVRTQFGKQLFMQNCSTCHGADASGMPKQGANLRDSVFVAKRSDAQLVSFLRVGRNPGDRDSVLGLTMPPRGGNSNLEDDELADIVAYLRLVKRTRGQSADSGTSSTRILAAR